MSNTVHEELAQLASKLTTIRQSGKKNWFPEEIWESAAIITNKLPISVVCKVLNVHPAYLRKKIADITTAHTQEPLTFLEIPQRAREVINAITINIENSHGHKLTIDGATTSSLIPLVNEFLKGGTSCSK